MSETKTLAEAIYLASAACNDEGVEWENQHGSPRREAEWQADAVTAHLAAILANPEMVEAVAFSLCAIDPSHGPYDDLIQQMVNEALDDARAAIAVIGARLGLA